MPCKAEKSTTSCNKQPPPGLSSASVLFAVAKSGELSPKKLHGLCPVPLEALGFAQRRPTAAVQGANFGLRHGFEPWWFESWRGNLELEER
ncbi:hypothetical protein [Paenibacillus sp. MMS20-IR301]|uniref:hypothetical protein n=1 Tax=Paenibacillus sp. MMS20-IR301 TaxID=2895946 RepID=UPI0028E9B921|nr:hypothetical protein [Paenibacillus sp. MMS20-IR301]WNS41609.1 hypothetical protein LOS79_21615 [Paenibacillus sp. MMS20-IR301]